MKTKGPSVPPLATARHELLRAAIKNKISLFLADFRSKKPIYTFLYAYRSILDAYVKDFSREKLLEN